MKMPVALGRDPNPPALGRDQTLALVRQLREATTEEQKTLLESRIVAGNLRFCAIQARRYKQGDLEYDDLMAVATAAFLEGARRFDPSKSVHFAAYARRCIHRDLVVYVRRHGGAIRLPREPRKGESERGRESVKAQQYIAIDRSAPSDRASFVVDSPEDGILDGIDAERLAGLVDTLPAREATVVRMRFGLAGMAPHDLAEIGAVLSVSKQRVQCLLDRALASLKSTLLAPKAAA